MTTRQELESAVREWRATREKRLAEEKIAARTKEREDELKEFIINTSLEEHYEGVITDGRVTRVVAKDIPICADRGAFSEFILNTRNLHLLQFALSVTAVREMQASGVAVPGVDMMTKYEISDRKGD